MPAAKFLRKTLSHMKSEDNSVFTAELPASCLQKICFLSFSSSSFFFFFKQICLSRKSQATEMNLKSSCDITTVWSPWTAVCACFVMMVFDVVFLKEIKWPKWSGGQGSILPLSTWINRICVTVRTVSYWPSRKSRPCGFCSSRYEGEKLCLLKYLLSLF